MYGAGCPFVCISKVLGLDPARLATLLSDQADFFEADPGLPAVNVCGELGNLVWDMNKPSVPDTPMLLDTVWHPTAGQCSIKLELHKIEYAKSASTGRRIVAEARSNQYHVICGASDHSRLVAGEVADEYLLWDPDTESTSIDQNLEGRLTLEWLFREYRRKRIEFWIYSLAITASAPPLSMNVSAG